MKTDYRRRRFVIRYVSKNPNLGVEEYDDDDDDDDLGFFFFRCPLFSSAFRGLFRIRQYEKKVHTLTPGWEEGIQGHQPMNARGCGRHPKHNIHHSLGFRNTIRLSTGRGVLDGWRGMIFDASRFFEFFERSGFFWGLDFGWPWIPKRKILGTQSRPHNRRPTHHTHTHAHARTHANHPTSRSARTYSLPNAQN
jgi:hypothetical protein